MKLLLIDNLKICLHFLAYCEQPNDIYLIVFLDMSFFFILMSCYPVILTSIPFCYFSHSVVFSFQLPQCPYFSLNVLSIHFSHYSNISVHPLCYSFISAIIISFFYDVWDSRFHMGMPLFSVAEGLYMQIYVLMFN